MFKSVLSLAAFVGYAQAFGGGWLPSDYECIAATGVTSDRIVNGVLVTEDEFPFLVRASIGPYLCGASLISDEWVLTAAHCVADMGKSDTYTAYVGAHTSYDGTPYVASKVIVHENYDADTTDYDIALVKLQTPVTGVSTYVNYANAAQYTTDGACATVAGWGTIESGGDIPPQALKVGVTVVNHDTCEQQYGSGAITDRMICAADTRQDSCQGDSGGPLFVKSDDSFTQIGIVSWGNGCADPDYAGVYTHLANFVDWIDTTVAAN